MCRPSWCGVRGQSSLINQLSDPVNLNVAFLASDSQALRFIS